MKTKLERFFAAYAWPITGGDDEAAVFAGSGRSACECTAYAEHIVGLLGTDHVQVFGFFHDENPDSEIARDYGGHDFALVDGRYIVDPWLREVDGRQGAFVFDLKASEDVAVVLQLYGKRECWKLVKLRAPVPVLDDGSMKP